DFADREDRLAVAAPAVRAVRVGERVTDLVREAETERGHFDADAHVRERRAGQVRGDMTRKRHFGRPGVESRQRAGGSEHERRPAFQGYRSIACAGHETAPWIPSRVSAGRRRLASGRRGCAGALAQGTITLSSPATCS